MAATDISLLDTINTFASISIPFLILIGGYLLNRRQQRMVRADMHRIQLDIEAIILGPQKGHFLVDLVVIFNNTGMTRVELSSLSLDVRGIKIEEDIKLLGDNVTANQKNLMAEFPEELVKANMLQSIGKKEKNQKKVQFFVEPSVKQRFSYVARFPDSVAFILVRVKFNYHKNSEHSAQRVFELQTEKKQLKQQAR